MVTTMDTTTANCHASSTNAADDDDDNHHLQEDDEESASLSQTTTTIAPPPLPPPLLPLSSKQVLEWSVEDVGRWLAANSFSAYTELFCDRHQIDGRVLVSLSAEDLRAEPLHLTVFGDIKRLCMAIEVLRKHAAAHHSSSLLENGSRSGSGSGSNSGEEGGQVMSNGGSALPHSRYSRQTMSSSLGAASKNALLRGQKRLRQKPLPPPDFEFSEGESEEGENAYQQRFDAGGGGSRFENDSPPPPRSVTTNSSRSEGSSSNSSSLSSASSTVSLTSLSRCYSDDCLESLDGSPCQHVNANSVNTTTSTSAIPLNVYVQQQGKCYQKS